MGIETSLQAVITLHLVADRVILIFYFLTKAHMSFVWYT